MATMSGNEAARFKPFFNQFLQLVWQRGLFALLAQDVQNQRNGWEVRLSNIVFAIEIVNRKCVIKLQARQGGQNWQLHFRLTFGEVTDVQPVDMTPKVDDGQAKTMLGIAVQEWPITPDVRRMKVRAIG